MKILITIKHSCRMGLVALILGMAGFAGYGQDLHTPYPIIFVHGINSDDTKCWGVMINYLETIGLSFGGRMDFCLNQDGDNNQSNFAFDYKDYTNTNASHIIGKGDFYTTNFDVDNQGNVYPNSILFESNEAAIYKQGRAIKDAIKHVLEQTGKEKVILVCHSMGGLAAREYLQNKGLWQQSNFDHHVAKLITIGTPHGGSNSWSTLSDINLLDPIDPASEAVRDLKKSSVFLNGGYEKSISTNTLIWGYNNRDVNCNGSDNSILFNNNEDYFVGLNNLYIPTDLRYSCVIGTGRLGSDGIVTAQSANIKNIYPNLNADIFVWPKPLNSIIWHSNLPDQVDGIIQALDEPNDDNPLFAYEIGENSTNKGFITYQPNVGENDIDLFEIIPSKRGLLSIGLTSIGNRINKLSLLDSDMKELVLQENVLDGELSFDVEPLLYYIRIESDPFSASWSIPYTLKTKLEIAPPAAMSVSPTSLQFYDVVIDAPKIKTVKLSNNGAVPFKITEMSMSGKDADQFNHGSYLPFEIKAGENQDMTIEFDPTTIGAKEAVLEIKTDSPDIPTKTVSLKGNATDHETKVIMSSIAESYNFRNLMIGTGKNKTITLQNTGSNAVTISDIALKGLNPTEYSITSPTDHSFDLTTGATKQIIVRFSPTSIGVKNDSLVILNNSDNHKPKLSIELYGNGTENYYSGNNNTLVSYEYWFDDQYDKKVSVAITQFWDSQYDLQVPTNELNTGLHSFHIRYLDSKGKWSSIVSEFFHKLPVTAGGIRKITGCEYWFDSDYDNKVATLVTPEQTVTVNNGIAVASLQNGLHSFHVRYKDDAGQWSSVVSEFFHKLPVTAGGIRKITGCEYWFDSDYDNKVATPVTPEQTVTVNNGIGVASLANGLHSYHVRYKDDAGQWSSVVSEFFHKLPFNASQTNLITTYRYWFDGNDAAMNTVNLPTPVNPYFLIRDLDTKSLPLGDHWVHFQFEDANHAWSSVASQSITIENLVPIANAGTDQSVNEGVTVTLDGSASYDPNGNTLKFKWTAPEGISLRSTTVAKPTFTAPEISANTSYTFSLIVNNGFSDSPADQVIVTVKQVDKPPYVKIAIGDVSVEKGAADQVIDLKTVFADDDVNDVLGYTITSNSNNQVVTATISGTGLTLSFSKTNIGTSDIVIKATSNGKEIESPFKVEVKTPTGIDEISNDQGMRVYPNPTKGIVTIAFDKLPAKDSYLIVSDLNGKVLLRKPILDKEIKIDLSGHPYGFYLIKTNLPYSKVFKIILK